MTCHPQGQFQGPSSTLQSFVRGRPGVALEQHGHLLPTRGFPAEPALCCCTLQGERDPGVQQQLQLLLLQPCLSPPLLS